MSQYDAVLSAAKQLSPEEKARLLEDVSASLRRELAPKEAKPPKRSLYGLFADLGPAPSAEEIDETRLEMWGQFPA